LPGRVDPREKERELALLVGDYGNRFDFMVGNTKEEAAEVGTKKQRPTKEECFQIEEKKPPY